MTESATPSQSSLDLANINLRLRACMVDQDFSGNLQSAFSALVTLATTRNMADADPQVVILLGETIGQLTKLAPGHLQGMLPFDETVKACVFAKGLVACFGTPIEELPEKARLLWPDQIDHLGIYLCGLEAAIRHRRIQARGDLLTKDVAQRRFELEAQPNARMH